MCFSQFLLERITWNGSGALAFSLLLKRNTPGHEDRDAVPADPKCTVLGQKPHTLPPFYKILRKLIKNFKNKKVLFSFK